MMPRPIHDEYLLDYAAGAAPEAVSVLVASHLELCPAARATLARLEAVGGVYLEQLPPAGLSPATIEAVFAKLDSTRSVCPRRSPPISPRAGSTRCNGARQAAASKKRC
jgi:putative transcriptional regulator